MESDLSVRWDLVVWGGQFWLSWSENLKLIFSAILKDLDFFREDIVETDFLNTEWEVSIFNPVLAIPHFNY